MIQINEAPLAHKMKGGKTSLSAPLLRRNSASSLHSSSRPSPGPITVDACGYRD